MRTTGRTRLLIALFIALFASLPACQAPTRHEPAIAPSTAPKVHLMQSRIPPEQLERANRAFADRYLLRISNACDAILLDNPDEAQCRLIRDMRATAAMSIYDIVTEPDPYMQTLNLTIIVTLQSIAWADEDNPQKYFGARGSALVAALKPARTEVWQLAAKIFSPSDLQILSTLIQDWRRANPDIRRLAFARFTDLMDSSEATAKEKASGLFDQIEQTRQTVDETRALAERTLYLTKRMPTLVAWRIQSTFDQLLTVPQITQLLTDVHTLAATADKLPANLDQQRKAAMQDLDAQRKALLADFDQRQPALDNSIKNLHETLTQAGTLTTDAKSLLVELDKSLLALQDLLKQGDAIAGRYFPPSAQPSATALTPPTTSAITSAAQARPFDIQDYTAALKEASQAARDLNEALINSGKLLDSSAWHTRIDEINAAADGRVHLAAEQSEILVESVFRRVYVALGVFLLVLVLARLISAWILKKSRLRL